MKSLHRTLTLGTKSDKAINTAMENKPELLVRGARVIAQLNEAKTLIQLKRETDRFTPKTTKRQYATDPIQVNQMKLVPYVNSGALQVDSVTKSSGKTYETTILFTRVDFQEENTPANVTFVASDGDPYNIAKIPLVSTNVKVRCDCLDFYWRFSTWNNKRKSLYGDPPGPYQKKTDRPPVNPKKKAALCKHLLRSVEALQQAGIVD